MSKKLSFKLAAEKILLKSKEPLTAKQIYKLASEENLIETSGETPEATMGAILYVDIRDNKSTKFKKAGKGLFALKSEYIDSAFSPYILIENQNQKVKKELKDKLHSMDPYQFEFLIGDLLQKIGYENVNVTKRSGDKGIDVNANLTVGGLTNVNTVIQVKRYNESNKINGSTITQLRGSAEVDQRGLVITTSDFTPDAYNESKAINKMPVSLVNGDRLIDLLIKYGVGIKKENQILLSLDNEYFENETDLQIKTADLTKNRSIWPLPGGTDKYVYTLNKLLESIKGGINTKDKLIKWFMQNFDSVKSEKTVQGYLNVPRSMGLVKVELGKFIITNDGIQYLKNKNLSFLYEVISKNVLAFDDIVEYLKTSNVPKNEEQIQEFILENFDVEWATFNQLNFRLIWLLNLDKIEKTDEGYKIKIQ